MTRLIRKKKGEVKLSSKKRHSFPMKYGPKEVSLLAETDNLHGRLSAPATKRILEREYEVFGKSEYEVIRGISSSHIRDLEKKTPERESTTLKSPHSVKAPGIGERRKPKPKGEPGFLRVDTVYQGDLKDKKGVCHLYITTQ